MVGYCELLQLNFIWDSNCESLKTVNQILQTLKVKMIILKFIAMLTLLSMGYCYWRIDPPRSKECSTYKVTKNVAVVPILCDEHGSITDKISKELCVQHCNEMGKVIQICLTSVTRVKCGIRSTLCWKIANISGFTDIFGL